MTTQFKDWHAVRDIFRIAQQVAREELLYALACGASGHALATAIAVAETPSLLTAEASYELVEALKKTLPENSLAPAAFERFMRIC